MEIVWMLMIGLVGGVLGMLAVFRKLPTEPLQWIGALVIGLLGGWLGGWLLNVMGLEQANWLGSLVVAFAGSALILMALRKAAGESATR